ncbi:MAG: hypothetical protein WCG27_06660, partial [Pseudomonadota bacterium]
MQKFLVLINGPDIHSSARPAVDPRTQARHNAADGDGRKGGRGTLTPQPVQLAQASRLQAATLIAGQRVGVSSAGIGVITGFDTGG